MRAVGNIPTSPWIAPKLLCVETGEKDGMKLHRIYALVVRHMYLYRRSLPRVMEIFYWPFLDLVIWGFITVYLMKFQGQIPG
ncbi:MAG TPA: hypothetical protein VJU02_07575, partial [Nitrospiraceae bacterium]|nr:hypothetical protein [Nitrospiraceae bacterium]